MHTQKGGLQPPSSCYHCRMSTSRQTPDSTMLARNSTKRPGLLRQRARPLTPYDGSHRKMGSAFPKKERDGNDDHREQRLYRPNSAGGPAQTRFCYNGVRMMRLARLSALVGLLLLCAAGFSAPTLTLDSEHFRFHYFTPEQANQAAALQADAEEAYTRLKGYFGDWAPEQRIPIYLFDDRAEFLKVTGTHPQDLVLGTASSENVIRLDASETFQKASSVIGHEVTHIFLFQFLGSRVQHLPLWLNEGLCQEAGGAPRVGARMRAIESFSANGIAPLARLQSAFPNEDNLNAYAQSQDAAAWLLDRGGWPRMLELLQAIRDGATFEDALERSYKMSPAQMERGWRVDLRSAAMPRLWGDMTGFVIVALMLFALGWGVITRRKKRKRQHEEEEAQVTPPPAWWPDEDEWR